MPTRKLTLAVLCIAVYLSLFLPGCGNSMSSTSTPPSPPPSFLYAMAWNNLQSSEIFVLPIDAGTGALGTPVSIPGPQPPLTSLAPAGTKFLYVSELPSAQPNSLVYGYAIDQKTGALTLVPGSPFQAPGTLILNGGTADNNFFYIGGTSFLSNGLAPTVSAFSIASDGSLAAGVAGSPFNLAPPTNAVAGPGPWIVSQSAFVFATEYEGSTGQPGGIAAFKADATTGVLTPVAGSPFSTGAVGSPAQVVYDAARGPFVYVSLANPPSFQNLIAGFAVDANTGVLTPVPGSPFAAASTATLTLDPSGQFLLTGTSGQNLVEFRIGSDGSLTAMPGVVATVSPPFAFSGPHFYATGSSTTIAAFNFDSSTGALTPVTGSPFAVGSFPRTLVAVTLP